MTYKKTINKNKQESHVDNSVSQHRTIQGDEQ